MKPGGEGIQRLVPLLLASLLLHLAVGIALFGITRREVVDRHSASNLTLEYLEPRVAEQKRTESGRPGPITVPGPRQDTAAKPRPLTLPRQVTPMELKQPQKHTAGATPTPVPGQTASVRPPAEDVTAIAPLSPTGKGNAAMTVGTVSGMVKGSGTGVGAGFGSGMATGGSGGRGSPAAAAGASLQRRATYLALIKGLITAHKQYPLAARRSRQEGSCMRLFAIARNGKLNKVEALSTCGHPYLDEAATLAITSVGTFPPLPEEFKEAEAVFTIPIKFTLENN